MGTPERLDLCKPCAVEKSRQGVRLKTVSGRTEQITCAACGRRRFGRTYEAVNAEEKEDPKP